MKTTPLSSFLKFYVMTSTQVDLFGIAHEKVEFILPRKMYVMPRIGRFVWTTCFGQCGAPRVAPKSLTTFLTWTVLIYWVPEGYTVSIVNDRSEQKSLRKMINTWSNLTNLLQNKCADCTKGVCRKFWLKSKIRIFLNAK